MKYEFRIEPVITPEIGYTVEYGWFPNCAWDLVSAPRPPPQREGFFRTKEEAQRAIDHLKGGADGRQG